MFHLRTVAHFLVLPPKPKLKIFAPNNVVAEDLGLPVAFLVATMFLRVLLQSSKDFVFQISNNSLRCETGVQALFLS